MALVDYDFSSDSDSDDSDDGKNVNAEHPPVSSANAGPSASACARSQRVKRKLPSLPVTFNTAPIDDPSLHQGRKRTRPFIDGEYATHIYIELKLSTTFCSILQDLLSSFPPSHSGNPLHPLFASTPRGTLHISLSQPLGLRRSQIQSFTSDLTRRLRSKGRQKFRLSLAGRCKLYHNTVTAPDTKPQIETEGGKGKGEGGQGDIGRLDTEEKEKETEKGVGSRGFVALRVGAGASELKHIVDTALDPLLDIYHQPNYHPNAEFHTSIAWTLTQYPPPMTAPAAGDAEVEVDLSSQPDLEGEDVITQRPPIFPVPYDEATIQEINDGFESKLMDGQPRNGWEIDCVHVKVGREIFVIPFN